ncbi:uncharacterized protein LOC123549832 [Mercenaria mercenaria]|uniref:uncharacterized protein LOC123549832 n=1 Tax=Mercenaria mercenaria TaxID=6596 RepID=UPI00234E785A|nr:uncharacterized protein LOC123549832 [Mercenaria mercenaria]
MANEQKLLVKCISKLDSMSHGLTDNRPKNLEKLKNTLKKETEVIYVNQILIYLLTLDFTIPLKNEEDIHKTDSELDKEIAETVFKLAQDQGRQVFALPCDSELHHQIESKVQEWYSQKRRHVDPNNPALGIATACTINAHLDVDKIVKHLEHLDIMHQWLELVSFKFPDSEAFGELMKAWEKWTEKIKEGLGEASACTYQLFSTMIKEANDSIQNTRINEIGRYCEEMYVSKYPEYKSHRKREVKIEQMETNEESQNSEQLEMAAVSEDKKQSLLNSPLYLWPVGIEPDVVYVILKLGAAEKKPETMHHFKDFVKSIGDVTYVVSPKYMLMSHVSKENAVSEGEEVTLNVRLGSTESKKTFQLKDTSALGSVLIFPGKRKPFQGKSFKRFRRMFDRMDTSTDTAKETLRGFQEYVLKTVKHLSQSTGAALLYDDADANVRCRDSLQEYLKSLSESNGVSEEEFSKELLRRSFEIATVPADTLVNLLMKTGYLQINEVDMSVTYTPGYRKQKYMEQGTAESSFLREWERFYKQMDKPSDIEMGTYSRKRKHHMPLFDYKRQRIIDV